MQKIENYNCEGLCIQAYCDSKYTHFTNQKIHGVKLNLCFCEKHAIEFENNFIDSFLTHKKESKEIKENIEWMKNKMQGTEYMQDMEDFE